jgi:hypothetical protein
LHLSTGREAVRGIGGPIGVRRGIVDIVFRGLDEFHRLAHVPCLVAVDGWAPVILGRERVFDAFRIDFRMRENRILLTRVAA